MIILNNSSTDIKKAADLLKEGKLVAFPTETVYGVGCIYNNIKAYQNLNKLKNRAPDKPYTVMLSDINDIFKFAKLDDKFKPFLNKFLPGSVTLLLPSLDNLPSHIQKNGIIGIRIPSNKEALTLLKEVGAPLLVPSLNKAGETPLFAINNIKKVFKDELDAIIVGKIKDNVPSTVISLINGITIIREGKIPSKILIEEYKKL